MNIKKPQVIGPIFILFGLLFVILAWGGHFQSKKVMNEGGRAVAKITDKKTERSGRSYKDTGGTDFNVYYTFETKDGKAMAGLYPIRKERWDSLRTGDSIEVAYDYDNPNYNFPVGEGSLVSAGMPIALSIFGIISIFVGSLLYRGKSLFKRRSLPATGPPEDRRVASLLDKIKSESLPILFGSYDSHVVFSNGHFFEIADSLPVAIEALRDLFASKLSADSIKQILPEKPDGRTDIVYSERIVAGKYQLSTQTHTCTVDAVYYDYLKMRYPHAEVFCRGPAQPITFYQDGILRAVVMPMKK